MKYKSDLITRGAKCSIRIDRTRKICTIYAKQIAKHFFAGTVSQFSIFGNLTLQLIRFVEVSYHYLRFNQIYKSKGFPTKALGQPQYH